MFHGGEWRATHCQYLEKLPTPTPTVTLSIERGWTVRISKIIVKSRFEMLKSKLLLNLDLIRTLFSLV